MNKVGVTSLPLGCPFSNGLEKGKSIPLSKQTYEQKLQRFEHFCASHKIDISFRRCYFYRFFTDKNFLQSAELTRHYDFGIEDICGVLWLLPKTNKDDAEFLKLVKERYPTELLELEQHQISNINLSSSEQPTRFANNDTFQFLMTFHTSPTMLNLLKEILLYCILRNDRCDDNPHKAQTKTLPKKHFRHAETNLKCNSVYSSLKNLLNCCTCKSSVGARNVPPNTYKLSNDNGNKQLTKHRFHNSQRFC